MLRFKLSSDGKGATDIEGGRSGCVRPGVVFKFTWENLTFACFIMLFVLPARLDGGSRWCFAFSLGGKTPPGERSSVFRSVRFSFSAGRCLCLPHAFWQWLIILRPSTGDLLSPADESRAELGPLLLKLFNEG